MSSEINESRYEIYSEGKIDIHNRKSVFNTAISSLKSNQEIHPENKELILQFIRDCTLGKTVIGKSKKKISTVTCLKHLSALKLLCREIKKSFNKIKIKDMEEFIQHLENDLILTKQGSAYSDETKVGIKKSIKKFWKWKDGENKRYPKIVDWIDTYVQVKDVPALSRAEIEKMISYASNPRDKALIMVLFDSGARAEELLNVRLKKEHLIWKDDLNCYVMRLEYSKTKPRTISLPLSTEVINEWLAVHPLKGNSQAQLFPMKYGNLRMFIKRIGWRILRKRVTPHMLRHSSATFYANKLGRYQLCYRYGWAMSSDMVDRYLDREGLLEASTPGIIHEEELGRVNKEDLKLKEQLALVNEAYSEVNNRLNEVMEELNDYKNCKHLIVNLARLMGREKALKESIGNYEKFDTVLPKLVKQT